MPIRPAITIPLACSLICLLTVVGCGGGSSSTPTPPATFSLGGTVSGLRSGATLSLQANGGPTVALTSNGAFSFAAKLADGSKYDVTVSGQPAGQRCQVDQGSGTVASAHVTRIAISCQIGYAYVINTEFDPALGDYQSWVSQYVVGIDGALRPSGADVALGGSQMSVALDAKAANVFFASATKDTLLAYQIGENGVLSAQPRTSLGTGDMPLGVTLTPDGKFVYAHSYGDGHVLRYARTADGGLAPAIGVQVAQVNSAFGLAIDASGKYAYASDNYSSTLTAFSVGADGGLTPLLGGQVGADVSPMQILLHPSGKSAYTVNNYGGSISQYAIGADGKLTPLAPARVAIAGRGMFMAISPNGKFAYANGVNDTIAQFAVGADGRLTPLSPAGVPGTSYSMAMAFTADGSNAFVTNNIDRTVVRYAVGADGQLTQLDFIRLSRQPERTLLFYR